MFMCNDTITKPACKTQSANCAFEGDFLSWISVRQRRRRERKSQVDVIDRETILCQFPCVCYVIEPCEVCIHVCTNMHTLKLLVNSVGRLVMCLFCKQRGI